MVDKAKYFLTSWTIWFGILQIGSAVVGFFGGFMDGPQAMTLITTGLGTIGLRFKTSQPITPL